MFIPLYDGNPTRFIKLHWVTLTIIALNIVIFLINLPFAPQDGSAGSLSIGFGHVPSVSNDIRTLPADYQFIPDHLYFLTAITYSFIHADIWHLGGNMLFLWVFGDNVEDAMGHFKFLIFYLVSAFAAAWFHALVFPGSDAPLIGASGAAAAIVTAYVLLHPRVKIWVLILGRIPLPIPAVWVIGAWILFQIFMFITDADGAVSWAAHVGGILAGAVLLWPLKRKEVFLFDKGVKQTEAPAPQDSEHKQVWGRRKKDD